MKEIALTDGTMVLVSDHHYLDVVNAGPWHNRNGYASRNIKLNGKWTTQHMHVFIAHKLIGLKGKIDHRNLDGYDNREENIREATKSQNAMNTKSRSNNKLQVKGVCQLETGKFRVQLEKDGEKCYDKTFDTLEEAKEAYRLASLKYHGEFGRTE